MIITKTHKIKELEKEILRKNAICLAQFDTINLLTREIENQRIKIENQRKEINNLHKKDKK